MILDAGREYDWSRIADVSRDAMDLVPAWGDAGLAAEGFAGVSQAFAAAGPVASHDGPKHVNDPDMLVVGIGWSQFADGHPTMAMGPQRPDLTGVEQRAHFSLWAMLAAPLLAGNDVRSMNEDTRAILTNRDVIAVDQDPLVLQGLPLLDDPRVIVKPLADGSVAVALFNGDAAPAADPHRRPRDRPVGGRLLHRARSVGAHRAPRRTATSGRRFRRTGSR